MKLWRHNFLFLEIQKRGKCLIHAIWDNLQFVFGFQITSLEHVLLTFLHCLLPHYYNTKTKSCELYSQDQRHTAISSVFTVVYLTFISIFTNTSQVLPDSSYFVSGFVNFVISLFSIDVTVSLWLVFHTFCILMYNIPYNLSNHNIILYLVIRP